MQTIARKRRAQEIELPPLTGPQMEICSIDERPERCIDVEGSPRSAKSWGVGFWIWKLAYKYPGIQVFYCRYKEEQLAQLRDIWSKVAVHFPEYLHPSWNAADQAWDFPNGQWIGTVYTGSRVFLSSIKASEQDTLHSKYKGKTLAVVIVEEANEIPQANYFGLKERLSQSRTPDGTPYRYPLKIVLVHNCVDEDHWIAEEFPLADEECSRPGHAHIRADLYSNAGNLGEEVMAGYEEDYPPGQVLRRTVMEGRRGVSIMGKPVYDGYFDRARHVQPAVRYLSVYPLLEGWDFSHAKPAVLWAQWIQHVGAFHILGGVQGFELFLEQFAPKVLEIRDRWFPGVSTVFSYCDPAGATNTSGSRVTAVTTLNDFGIYARHDGTWNNAPERYAAIQAMAGYLFRNGADSAPAFKVNPRCIEVRRLRNGQLEERKSDLIATALQVGYVWDDDHAAPQGNPNVRRPKKNFSGDNYSHLMNGLEYIALGERLVQRATEKQMARERGRLQQIGADRGRDIAIANGEPHPDALRLRIQAIAEANRQARDHDPADRLLGKGRYRVSGAGHRLGSRGGWR